ncbi:MAG: ABC transporter substrate-binding protein, partial [Acidobacteriota bacterium]|nr:ABC transporter substrate-binding protein [Acidobacteriota bacterium]
MATKWLWVAVLAWTACAAGQGPGNPGHVCECGAHPPGPPKDRVVEPYAGEPADLSPFEKFSKPYYLNYTRPNIYSGAGRDIPDPKNVTEVRIGFLGPIEKNPDSVYGIRMLHGAQMAVDEANANGGYGGKPFRLMLHNDYDNWQAKAVYGDDRPTDPSIWGSSSDEAVKMIYNDHDWAIFGSISSEATHIVLRVALRAEIPIVNSASTDPTIPETYIPWYFTDIQDDRVQCYTLARRIFTELGLKRAGILRVNNRYGRMGVPKFRDAARRLGHPVVIEQKYLPGDTDFTRELKIIRDSRVDALVLWANEQETAAILKQMRAMGMKTRVFGSYRTLGPEMLAEAGPAADGFEAVFPYDPTSKNPEWLDFNRRFDARYHEKPDQFASLAYDAMNALLDAICKAGLNRARIHDALADMNEYDGVTGHMIFDPNQKNVAPMYLGTVHNGSVTYRIARMDEETPKQAHDLKPATQTPYARIGEGGVIYAGPQRPNEPGDVLRVVLFGPKANSVVQSAQVRKVLSNAQLNGRKLELIPIESSQNWGAASTQLVHALWEQHALAIVALDRDCSHLAEQLSLKAFVPVIAISDDHALTSTNIPWIFRIPSGTSPQIALQLVEKAIKRSGPNAE